jgi:hypothetical protein
MEGDAELDLGFAGQFIFLLLFSHVKSPLFQLN